MGLCDKYILHGKYLPCFTKVLCPTFFQESWRVAGQSPAGDKIMKQFSTTHIIFLIAVVIFLAGSMWLVSKLNRRWQNVMFILGALLCAGGIFYRYGMGLSWEGGITWKTLALEMLQVCNFNFILVLLMLIPRFELARQYGIFFSMFAASTTLFSLSSSWKNLQWYDIQIMNSLINHVLIIALPLWIMNRGSGF